MKVHLNHLVARALLGACVASTFATAGFAATAEPVSATSVQQALSAQMDGAAKDITVAVDGGVVRLGGWAQGPKEVDQARYIASRVAGVEQAYSSGVHTWSAKASD